MDEGLIDRDEVVALRFNVSDIAAALHELLELVDGGDDDGDDEG